MPRDATRALGEARVMAGRIVQLTKRRAEKHATGPSDATGSNRSMGPEGGE